MAMPARATYAVISLQIILAVTLVALAASGCTAGNFSGGSGKKIDSGADKPEKRPPSTTTKPDEDLGSSQPAQPSQPVQPSTTTTPDSVQPSGGVDGSTVVTPVVDDSDADIANSGGATPPAIDTNNSSVTPTATPTTPEESAGQATVPVTCFVNMEQGYHGTDEGYIIQLVDSSGVVAAGPATIEAVRNGEPTDGQGAYPGMKLNFDLTYVREAKSGSGTLNVCYSDPNVAPEKGSCQDKRGAIGGEGDRPPAIVNQPAQWTASSDGGKPKFVLSGNYNLSTHHPVWAFAKAGACFKDFQSPIVLDLNRNGRLDLIDAWNDRQPVSFDINGDGSLVRTGWVAAGDGLLALDVDGNGRIDDGLELFGEYTKSVKAGTPKVARGERTFANGFQALAQYDENQDGVIDTRDAVYARLVLWRDRDADGVSQAGELAPLSAHKITAVSLAYVKSGNVAPVIVANNEVRLIAKYVTAGGTEHFMADVWFKQRRHDPSVVAQTKAGK